MTLRDQGIPSRPWAQFYVAQFESSLLDLSFFDSSGTPATPSALRYRLDNLATGTCLTPWTTLTPSGSSYTLTLTPAQNTLERAYNEREVRQVTVESTIGGLVKREIFPYTLVNQNVPA
jgi:hypothetical protein